MFYAQSIIAVISGRRKTRKQHKQAVRKDAVNITIVWGAGRGEGGIKQWSRTEEMEEGDETRLSKVE